MKKLKFIGLFMMAIGLFACGGETKTADSAGTTEVSSGEATTDLEGMVMVDLTDYDIPATIYIPDETKGKREIVATEWGSVQIMVGKKFGIEIVPFGISIAEKTTELKNASVYSIEMISEEANKLVYKKSIKGTELEPEVHFFITKEFNGDLYELKSIDKSYNERAIDKMIISAETFAGKSNS